MAQSDALRRYLDEGMRFSQLTQSRAEEIVNRLVKAGELQADQAQSAVQELLDRSRKSTERLLAVIRKEVGAQVGSLGLATKADLARLERRVDALARAAGSTTSTQRATKASRTTKATTSGRAAKSGSTAKSRASSKATAKKAGATRTTKKAGGAASRRSTRAGGTASSGGSSSSSR